MNEENISSPGEQSGVSEQITKLNNLLRDFETALDDPQHELLTRLFTERAVLTAMREQVKSSQQQGWA